MGTVFRDILYPKANKLSKDIEDSIDVKYSKAIKYFTNSVQNLHLIIPRQSLISLIVLMMLASKYYRERQRFSEYLVGWVIVCCIVTLLIKANQT